MSTAEWKPTGRPLTDVPVIPEVECTGCGRAVYVRDGDPPRCRGCDDPIDDCYCPRAKERA